jgi:hypothetical protein
MTLGDLLRPEGLEGGSSNYFSRTRSDRLLLQSKKSNRSAHMSSAAVLEGQGGKEKDDEDDWMEGGAFQDMTAPATSKDEEIQSSKKKKGRPSAVRAMTNDKEGDSCPPSGQREKRSRAKVTVTSSIAGRGKNVTAGSDSCSDDDDDDIEAHRPFFPKIPYVTPKASPLILTFKENKSVVGASANSSLSSSSSSSSAKEEPTSSSVDNTVETVTSSVPCFTMRYLKHYQVQGVQWLWAKYAKRLGNTNHTTTSLNTPQPLPIVTVTVTVLIHVCHVLFIVLCNTPN